MNKISFASVLSIIDVFNPQDSPILQISMLNDTWITSYVWIVPGYLIQYIFFF